MTPFFLSPLLMLIFVLEELSSAIIKVEFQLPLFFPFFHLLIIKKSSVLKLSVRDLIPKVILCKRVKPKLVQLFFFSYTDIKNYPFPHCFNWQFYNISESQFQLKFWPCRAFTSTKRAKSHSDLHKICLNYVTVFNAVNIQVGVLILSKAKSALSHTHQAEMSMPFYFTYTRA